MAKSYCLTMKERQCHWWAPALSFCKIRGSAQCLWGHQKHAGIWERPLIREGSVSMGHLNAVVCARPPCLRASTAGKVSQCSWLTHLPSWKDGHTSNLAGRDELTNSCTHRGQPSCCWNGTNSHQERANSLFTNALM